MVLVTGCAKKAPPSGGPPDLTAPHIIASVPDSGDAGVSRTPRISISFSEGMDPLATSNAVSLAPRVEIESRRWRSNTLELRLADTLRADQTYTLFVGTGARDRRGNVLVEGATVTFSTADAFPAGLLSGEVQGRGLAAAGIYLWCYVDGREPDSTARDFDALALTDRDGRFRLPGLRVPERYRLWAFADLNNNRSFEPQQDVLTAIDTVFALTEASPAIELITLEVVNPRAPGYVKGAIVDTLGDSTGVVYISAHSEADSARNVIAPIPDEGLFEIEVDAGAWLVRAFRDLNRNKRWDPGTEPASEARRFDLPPAGIVEEVQLVMRPAAAPESEDP